MVQGGQAAVSQVAKDFMKYLHPIAQKILDAGGTMLKQPLLKADGEINQECVDELFNVLEREPIQAKINRKLKQLDKTL